MTRTRRRQRADLCPCGSRRRYAGCCGRWHAGEPAPTPVLLMRSRYAAYARGLADYIIETTDPLGDQWQGDRDAWRAEIEHFCAQTGFRGLTVLDDHEDGDSGEVSFEVLLRLGDQDRRMTERSRFVRRGGRWLYVSGSTTVDEVG